MRVGELEILCLVDAWGELGALAERFPEVTAEAWEPFRARYPSLFDGGTWRLPTAGFLVRGGGATVLVDTGTGPPGNDFWPDADSALLRELAAAGASPDDVDLVFLTHLHVDHVGWNVVDGAPAFPNARYVTHEAGWQLYRDDPVRAARPTTLRSIAPLEPLGVLDLVAGETELAPGVVAFDTPGHLPGHMSVRVESGGERCTILGDVGVHPAQLTHPGWAYDAEHDPDGSRRTRERLLPGLAGQLVACGHFPGGLGRIRREEDGLWWESLSGER
jgi:glyoxylase-like metal-dependent hydrolase (beta-lactamase superfamily II)